MLSRKVVLPVALAAAAGAPYVVMEGDLHTKASNVMQSVLPASSDSLGGSTSAAKPAAPPPVAGWQPHASEYTYGARAAQSEENLHEVITGPTEVRLEDVIRFDVSPQWVTGRWPRVTATLAELGMEGLRVPLLTGTETNDLAGSLTYYFDRQHKVQRISFDGYTGDERKVMEFVTRYFHLQPAETLDAGMYVSNWNGKPTSAMRVTRAPVVSARSPHAQVRVLLELNRPSAYYGMSPQFNTLLEADRHSWRW